ncbi:hypothetical protein HY990_05480 [Candidatus Micrarchaeota archaeon]|nr:hypothetical protein [Candidatus Micrarchaeota archaeon]
MKKVEYVQNNTEQHMAPTTIGPKFDDATLPEFSKEVPTGSKIHPQGDQTTIEYQWKNSKSGILRVKRITFTKTEDLEGFYRAAIADGEDTIRITHKNEVYVLRKIAREVAQEVYKAYSRIKGIVQKVVGYLTTMIGNDYLITKIEGENWSFDRRLSGERINTLEIQNLDGKAKSNLVEKIVEKMAELHARSFILGKFTINNVLLSSSELFFSDLRRVRETRRRAFLVEEIKDVLQYLFTNNIARRDDVYYAIAYYVAKNQNVAEEWYAEKTKKKPKDTFEVVSKIEEAVYA